MKRVPVTGAEDITGTRPLCCMGLKPPSWSVTQADEFWLPDLRNPLSAQTAVTGVDQVYHTRPGLPSGVISRRQFISCVGGQMTILLTGSNTRDNGQRQ